jgi:hypothetical protein
MATRRDVIRSGAALFFGAALASEVGLAGSSPAGAAEARTEFEDDATNEVLGTIVLFAGNFTPVGFRGCRGESLSIQSETLLYELIGFQYGGADPNFDLPNLTGNLPKGGSAMRYMINVDGRYPHNQVH